MKIKVDNFKCRLNFDQILNLGKVNLDPKSKNGRK